MAGLSLDGEPLQMGLTVRSPPLRHIRNVFVQKQVVLVVGCHLTGTLARPLTALRLVDMSNLDRRRGHFPRRQREQRAFRLVQVGGAAGAITVISLIFAIVGVVSFALPVLALIVTAISFFLFQRTTGQR